MTTPTLYVIGPAPLTMINSADPDTVWAVPSAFVTGTDPTLARVFCAPHLVTALLSDPDILVRSKRLSDLINIVRFDIPGFVGNMFPSPPPYSIGAKQGAPVGAGGNGQYTISIRLNKWRGSYLSREHGPVGDKELLLMFPDEQTDVPPSSITSAGTLDVSRSGL